MQRTNPDYIGDCGVYCRDFAPLIGSWVASIPNSYNYNPVLHTLLPGLGTLIQILFRVETGIILLVGGIILERIDTGQAK